MIGKMRHRITFQVLTIVSTPGGGSYEQWTDEFSTFCEAFPLNSGRQLQDNQVVLRDGYTFRVRWAQSRDIDKKRQIMFNGVTYVINSIKPYTPKGNTVTLKDFYEIIGIADV